MFKLISATFFRQVFAGLCQLAALVVIARTLSVAHMGQYTVIILIPAIVSQMITLGIQSANIYGIGRQLIRAEHALYVNLVTILCLSIVGMASSILFMFFFHETAFPDIPLNLLILASSVILPLTAITALPSIFQGKQEFLLYNITCIMQPLFLLLSVSFIVLFFKDIESITLAFITSNFTSCFFIVLLLVRTIKPKKYPIMLFYKRFFSYSIQSHLSNIITLLNYRSSIFLISYFTSPALVGIYTVSMQLVEKLWLPSQAASIVLLPKLANILNDSNSDVTALTLQTARIVLILSLIITIFFVSILSISIDILFGIKYSDSVEVALLLLPGILAWIPSRVIANDIAARGNASINLRISIYTLLTNIIFSIVLIYNFHLLGAAVATSIAYCSDLVYRVYAYKKITGYSVVLNLIPTKRDFALILTTLKGFA